MENCDFLQVVENKPIEKEDTVEQEKDINYMLYNAITGEISDVFCKKSDISNDFVIIKNKTPKKNCKHCYGLGRHSFYYLNDKVFDENKRLIPCKCLLKN
jgi:hypothetical protein